MPDVPVNPLDNSSVQPWAGPRPWANGQEYQTLVDAYNAISATGGQISLPPGDYGLPAAWAPATGAQKIIVAGSGPLSSRLISRGDYPAINNVNPLNSSTDSRFTLRDVGLVQLGASTTPGFVDTGGSFVTLERVRISGYKYNLVLNQTELAEIEKCDFESPGTANVWLTNGADYSPGANALFTNRIRFQGCQFNASGTAWNVVDDGGVSHSYLDSNFNGGVGHIRAAGCTNLVVAGSCEMESATGPCIVLTNLSLLTSAGVGQCNLVRLADSFFTPLAGQAVVNAVSCGALVIDGSVCSSTVAPVSGLVNVNLAIEHGGIQTSSGGAWLSGGNATNQLSFSGGTLNVNQLKTSQGATGSRPSAATVGRGAQWYDTTLNTPIWSDGSNWRNGIGTVV